MKRRLPATRRGEVVLALIIVPPLNADAIRRAPAPPRPETPVNSSPPHSPTAAMARTAQHA